MALVEGLPLLMVRCNCSRLAGFFTCTNSQHWVLAQEGDHITASISSRTTSSLTGRSSNLRMLLRCWIASINSIYIPPGR